MRNTCGLVVELLGEICVKFIGFCTFLVQNKSHVEKPGVFTTNIARFFHEVFHGLNWVFVSVLVRFLPTINRTNKNNNYILLTFNYWRI